MEDSTIDSKPGQGDSLGRAGFTNVDATADILVPSSQTAVEAKASYPTPAVGSGGFSNSAFCRIDGSGSGGGRASSRCCSVVAADHSSGGTPVQRLFCADPLHASTICVGSFEQQTNSSVPGVAAGELPELCTASETGALAPLRRTETDVEDKTPNPLLQREYREGGDGGAEEGTACVEGEHRGGPTDTPSTSRGRSGGCVGATQTPGKDASNLPDAQPAASGVEAAAPSGGVSWTQSEGRAYQARLDELVLLSFNAGLLEYKLCGLRVYQNPPFTQRRLHHIPAALLSTGADIICLQEVYGDNHADFIIESTRHKLPFVGRRTSGGRFSLHNGLMVLSKYPIVHTQFHKFEDVTYIERCFASKGMLEVAVDVPSIGVIAIFNIHLASGAVDPESRYVEDVRAAEIRQLLKACDAAADRGHVPLVIGDLNAAPHLCASNYKCFVERGWRDCWLHVHGHQRHLLQHHLLHQQQLLEEQQLDDQGIELHDRHIRRDLFVRVRRQRRMKLRRGPEVEALQPPPQAPPQVAPASAHTKAMQQSHISSSQATSPRIPTVSSDADSSDAEREQKQQLLGQRHRQAGFLPRRNGGSREQSMGGSSSTVQRGSNCSFGGTTNYTSNLEAGRSSPADTSRDFSRGGSLELCSNSSSDATAAGPRRPQRRSKSALGGRIDDEEEIQPARGLLGGYFGRAGGGVQLPLAFELPAAAAWAHREFFLTAKRRLIEQQQKWLGGGDKAPVLDVRLSLSAPQQHQRGVDATPLASDCSLASCSTALTAARSGDTALLPAKAWRSGFIAAAPVDNQWPNDGADGTVADWLLSDTDEETESGESRDAVIHCAPEDDRVSSTSCSRRDFTWDPENPLNSIGPHAGCHGLRCDYVFLPPHQFAGGLYPFLPVAADILMRDPRVLVDACCFGCFGEVMLVTLSDHYAVRITLRRSTDTDIADFWGSCAAEAAALRSAAATARDQRAADQAASLQAND
ncbi:endonuclease/exonuclease/phosphatase domain-containing protein, putative [Eimeria mitis]|uniref:Endonuclease/exonuclease/phosphatase domain-containing protein, putative n=1 Tax=Eimeria mitis TaxID=44415 RepID=U6KII2_9EIME|nr:endonuclease/exonuclease/phosphatase domain-containing protein, putative [Eimeria mitis]CDJ36606.1 endonuclease/exonuclease/phosphatase domain-containing protein, putative [Eimeria mitis]